MGEESGETVAGFKHNCLSGAGEEMKMRGGLSILKRSTSDLLMWDSRLLWRI